MVTPLIVVLLVLMGLTGSTAVMVSLSGNVVTNRTTASIEDSSTVIADGAITLDEIKHNALLKVFLAGDVDVDKDGVNELSIGMRFSAVPAVIGTTS